MRGQRLWALRGPLTRMTDAVSAVFVRLLGLLQRLFQASVFCGRSISCRRMPASGLSPRRREGVADDRCPGVDLYLGDNFAQEVSALPGAVRRQDEALRVFPELLHVLLGYAACTCCVVPLGVVCRPPAPWRCSPRSGLFAAPCGPAAPLSGGRAAVAWDTGSGTRSRPPAPPGCRPGPSAVRNSRR